MVAALVSQLGYPTSESEMATRLVAISQEQDCRTLIAEVRRTSLPVLPASACRGTTNGMASTLVSRYLPSTTAGNAGALGARSSPQRRRGRQSMVRTG
jgi:hypothetical protein